jgi:hypothetical protein
VFQFYGFRKILRQRQLTISAGLRICETRSTGWRPK